MGSPLMLGEPNPQQEVITDRELSNVLPPPSRLPKRALNRFQSRTQIHRFLSSFSPPVYGARVQAKGHGGFQSLFCFDSRILRVTDLSLGLKLYAQEV